MPRRIFSNYRHSTARIDRNTGILARRRKKKRARRQVYIVLTGIYQDFSQGKRQKTKDKILTDNVSKPFSWKGEGPFLLIVYRPLTRSIAS